MSEAIIRQDEIFNLEKFTTYLTNKLNENEAKNYDKYRQGYLAAIINIMNELDNCLPNDEAEFKIEYFSNFLAQEVNENLVENRTEYQTGYMEASAAISAEFDRDLPEVVKQGEEKWVRKSQIF